jgi:DNA-binding MarR family transcriptional regulator
MTPEAVGSRTRLVTCHVHQAETYVTYQLFPVRWWKMDSEVRWLTADEEHLWRGWLKLNGELASTLQRELQQDVGLSMPDFEVLVHLTDNPDGRVRVTELAGLLQWERSRVSHHIKRMEHRGLVERMECSMDGRGAFVAITPQGRAAIEEAAPGHVMAVRRLMFDVLSEEEKAALAAVIEKLLAHGG